MHNITNAFVIIDIYKGHEELESNMKYYYAKDLSNEFKIALFVMCGLNLLALMFLLNLIVFHIELKYKGLTTYEFLKLKENIPKESKIVVKVNQELRDEMMKEQNQCVELKKEQALLWKELENKAMLQAQAEKDRKIQEL